MFYNLNKKSKCTCVYYNSVFLSRDKIHIDWCKAWVQTLTELQQYVRQHHTTGLVWAKTGAALVGIPPPPPPSMPMEDISLNVVNDDRSALFAQINQGEDITKSKYFFSFLFLLSLYAIIFIILQSLWVLAIGLSIPGSKRMPTDITSDIKLMSLNIKLTSLDIKLTSSDIKVTSLCRQMTSIMSL